MPTPSIRQIIIDALDSVDSYPENVTPETRLVEDAGLDSLDVINFTMYIEEQLDLQIGDEDVDRLHTVGDWEKYLEGRRS